MQEHLDTHFRSDDYKGFLNESSLAYIAKTDEKNPKKEKDIGWEH